MSVWGVGSMFSISSLILTIICISLAKAGELYYTYTL